MRGQALLAVILLGAGALAAQQQPTADDVIAKYVEAIGGAKRLAAVQTMKMTGRASIADGKMDSPVTMLQKRPSSTRMELNYQGQTLLQVFDGSVGWVLVPMTSPRPEPATPEEVEQMRDASDFDGPLVNYSAKGYRVANLGLESASSERVWKLQVIRPNGTEQMLYISSATWLPVETVVRRKQGDKVVEVESYPGDYRLVDGLKLPFSMEQKAEGHTVMKMVFSKIELNNGVADSAFKMPEGK
ncbi:MAG: hypothetical protein ABI693_20105 [Bryobacteraceae bacterium]